MKYSFCFVLKDFGCRTFMCFFKNFPPLSDISYLLKYQPADDTFSSGILIFGFIHVDPCVMKIIRSIEELDLYQIRV